MQYLFRATKWVAGLGLGLIACAQPAHAEFLNDLAPAELQDVLADRAAILAMAGNYKVTFDFRETLSLVADYTLAEPSRVGGEEVVRVVEDLGTTIRLQHILVVRPEGSDPIVIKHWRQDWAYEPPSVLVYAGLGEWRDQLVAPEEREGVWAQTVWQTDDSPRYGALGHWRHKDGVSSWMSGETKRPLPRRDAVKYPPFSWIIGTNRHLLTLNGWAHEQDNAKLGWRDGAIATFAHEVVLNTYDRFDDFNTVLADAYWEKSAEYWAGVRAAWDHAAGDGIVRVAEEAEFGSVIAADLMGWAEEIVAGTLSTADALERARVLIRDTDAGLGSPSSSLN